MGADLRGGVGARGVAGPGRRALGTRPRLAARGGVGRGAAGGLSRDWPGRRGRGAGRPREISAGAGARPSGLRALARAPTGTSVSTTFSLRFGGSTLRSPARLTAAGGPGPSAGVR